VTKKAGKEYGLMKKKWVIGKKDRRVLLIFQKVLAAAFAAIFVGLACNSSVSVERNGRLYEQQINLLENSNSFENSDLFTDILSEEIRGVTRLSVIRSQLETDGTYNGQKQIDIAEFAHRQEDVRDTTATASFYLDDLVKWGNYGFVTEKVFATKAQLDAYFKGDSSVFSGQEGLSGNDWNGETATLPAGVILRVQVYDRAPSFRLTAKGKLDVLNPVSEIIYTPRLTNAQGTVTDIRLEGADAELFAAEVVDGVVHLTMAKGCTYSTRTTYRVTPVLTFCGQEVTGSTLSIRVTQSALRLAKLSNRTVYQSQTAPLVQVLSITSPATAEFGEITLNSRSTAALRNAVEAAGGIEVSGGVVRIPAKAFASLKPGRYTVILDVTPENAAADAKPIQTRFTLTVQK